MNYHQYPNTFNWTQINTYGSTAQKGFLKQLYNDLQSFHLLDGSTGASFSNIKTGLESYGYMVNAYNSYNSNSMKNELLLGRPLILNGKKPNDPNGVGHTYICDGYKDTQYRIYYLTVYLPGVDMPSNGLLNYNPYSPQTDLRTYGNYNLNYNQWHMNWGTPTNCQVWHNYSGPYYCEDYDEYFNIKEFISPYLN